MTGDLSGYNQFVRVARRTKRQREKANSPVVHVVQLESPLERLSDCRTVPYLRFFLVRNEEVVGSNPISSTKIKLTQPCEIRSVGRGGHFSDFCVPEMKIRCLLSLPILISIRAASEAFCKPRTREFWRVQTRCAVALGELRLSP